MARITASLYTSHVPAIGAALDMGKTQEPYWQPLFQGYDFGKQWLKDNKPDVIFLVFNDHATAFSLEMMLLVERGQPALALTYALISIIAGLTALYVGLIIMRVTA